MRVASVFSGYDLCAEYVAIHVHLRQLPGPVTCDHLRTLTPSLSHMQRNELNRRHMTD